MLKKFLIGILIVLFFSISSSSQEPLDTSKYTFSYITSVLNDKVFKEARAYIKKYELFPYTQEKGVILTNAVADIIIRYDLSRELILKEIPSVSLLVSSEDNAPGSLLFYIQIKIKIIEYDDSNYGHPILGHLLIVKNIFVAVKDKTSNT